MEFLDWILLLVSLFLILIVSMQSSQDNINSAFSGEKSELFDNKKQRGLELFLSRASISAGTLFIFLALLKTLV